MEVILILAVSENDVIGRDNKIPWHISADLKWFKANTYGYPVIMGRLNYESMGKPLPGRTNIILTRNPDYKADGCITVNSVKEALSEAEACGMDKIFIAGGGEIYKLFLDAADKIILTRIHNKIDGNVYFHMPDTGWAEVRREDHLDEKPYSYSFITYERKKKLS